MRRFLIVWHFFLPLEYSCCSSGSFGRWIGRSVPSCQKGGCRTSRLPWAVRPSRQTLQLCGPEAAVDLLKPDSTPDAARESICSHSIGSSQRAGLVLLEWDSVSRRSE